MNDVAALPVDRPVLRRLRIQRYRGLEEFVWNPGPRLNVLLGGGDVGKTTVLDAIALLLSPSSSVQVGEADFYRRETDRGLSIEGAFWFPDKTDVLDGLSRTPWPWGWNGSEPVVPDITAPPEGRESREAVMLFRVRANEDYEVSWEIVNPNGTYDHLPVAVRRRIGLVWLEGDDRDDKDLRFVYGSALDRLLGDRALRSRLSQALSEQDVRSALLPDKKANLAQLDGAFADRALPTSLDVGFAGSRGPSLNALIGLTADRKGARLPLTNWGAGTRRLAALEIAAANQSGAPVTVVDELERGLEPHRQRILVRRLKESGNQVFLTTHSSTILSAAGEGTLWFMDGGQKIGPIVGRSAVHVGEDPETLLAKLAIVAEGKTEVEFVEHLLELALDGLRLERGIWVTDGHGNDTCLQLLESLDAAGIVVGGFVDFEGAKPERWRRLRETMGDLLWQWDQGCIEANLVPFVPAERLQEFVEDPDGELTGQRYRTLQDRLRTADKSWAILSAEAADMHRVVAEAASGFVPDWVPAEEQSTFKSHGRSWFKRDGGGTELAKKCVDLRVFDRLGPKLLPFLNAVRKVADLPPLTRMPS